MTLAADDRTYLWHPFTQQQGWHDEDAPIIERGDGACLWDVDGPALHRRRLVAVVHGARPPPPGDRHRHPRPARPRRPLDDARPDARAGDRAGQAARRDRAARAAAASSTRTPGRRRPRSRSRWRSSSGSSAAAPTRRRTKFVTLRNAYHGDTIGSVSVGGIDLFHATYRPLLFETLSAEPGDAADMEALLRRERGRGRRGRRRAARAGRRRDPHPPRRLPARGARAVRPPRRAADRRRGRDRLRPHRAHVRLRARGRRARPDVPGQGHHRRLPAAGGDAHDRARSTRASWASTRTSARSSTATPTRATRSPARPRSRTSTCSSRRTRSRSCSRRSSCSRSCCGGVKAIPTVREVRQRGFMVGIELERVPARRADGPPGDARGAPRAARSCARSATSSC